MSPASSRVQLTRAGLHLGDETVPLLAGSIHYWRLPRSQWRPCLQAIKDMGMRLVDTYVPWGVHERRPGELDLGSTDERLDVAAFLRLAHELGLHAVVRPGPHINAELTYFGLPERVVWDEACQARSAKGNPVILPFIPRMFPVPSYASAAFLDEVTRYYHLLGEALQPLRYPAGPIVLIQIDNEGAMYFRDGAYDQDYHPDAIAAYRALLRRKYGTITKLRERYAIGSDEEPGEQLRFSDIEPPRAFEATRVDQLIYYLDWAELQEEVIANAFARFAEVLEEAGLGGIPTSHNFPLAQDTTPLNAARIGRAVDLIGYDYYNRAEPLQCRSVARRTSELSLRSDALDMPAYACEIGAGFPPYFPSLSEVDSEFTVMTALAYGLRGFNLYMAVERDRWIGSPIDPRGNSRPFAKRYQALIAAIGETGLASLYRRTPVRIVVPRLERRIARVMHAFGPASGALFAISGSGASEACLEDDLGLGYPVALTAQQFVDDCERALRARGVPYALVSGEDAGLSLTGASWLLLASAGGLDERLADELTAQQHAGVRLSIGPRVLSHDGQMRPLPGPHPLSASAAMLIEPTGADLDQAVAEAIDVLGLPTYPCSPEPGYITVFEDAAGDVQVLFAGNPGSEQITLTADIGARLSWRDVLSGERIDTSTGKLELDIPAQSVRMLARQL